MIRYLKACIAGLTPDVRKVLLDELAEEYPERLKKVDRKAPST